MVATDVGLVRLAGGALGGRKMFESQYDLAVQLRSQPFDVLAIWGRCEQYSSEQDEAGRTQLDVAHSSSTYSNTSWSHHIF